MSKAVAGAIEIAAGVVLVATGVGAGLGFSLIFTGVGTELSALAGAMDKQQGSITSSVRQSAAPRRIIYGTQRVGAVEIYESSTGSSYDQLNGVFVVAAHEITNFLGLYLDSRQVFWAGGPGSVTRNGISFGGGADGQTHYAPDGSSYMFANAISGHRGVYVEACYGDQAFGSYFAGLTANDRRWGPNAFGQCPSLVGHAAIYLKCEYNTTDFPNKPNVRLLVAGKPVYDPRTQQTAYSNNWALVVADILTNSDYGLGDVVNTEQLIAAANICDEQVAFSGGGGGSESRYTANYTWTLDKDIQSVLNELMDGAGGRLSYIEGQWYIFPATYVAPTLNLTSDRLIAASPWMPQRKFRDKVNAVQGTYIAPTYPYSVSGDYYTQSNVGTQNNFDSCWLPTSYPTFTEDVAHAYPSNQWLLEDGGIELTQTLDLPSVTSVTQAQRLAKIALLRNRQQGSGTLTFGLEAWQVQPNDTITMTWPSRGWFEKALEVVRVDTTVNTDSDAPQINIQLTVQETDPTVYEWLATDELSVTYQPTILFGASGAVEPPTDLVLTSSAATALVQPSGTVIPQIQVTWNTPDDNRVTSIQVQYQLTTATTWSDGGTVSVASNISYIPAVAGQAYNVQIRSLTGKGATSAWVGVSGFSASLLLNTGTQTGVGIGSLSGQGYNDGTAGIVCNPFSTLYGTTPVSILPSGAVTITGLSQQTNYYVYYDDPTYAGGDITPVATVNRNDLAGVVGRFLIDNVVTPYCATSTGGGGGGGGGSTSTARYAPSSYSDQGTSTTQNPTQAYDGNTSTYATVSGTSFASYSPPIKGANPPPDGDDATDGNIVYSGFPSLTTSSALNLYVSANIVSTVTGGASAGSYAITASINGNYSNLTQSSTNTNIFSLAIPSGTNLGNVSVQVSASGGATGTVGPNNHSSVSTERVQVAEIYISQ